MSKQTKLDTYTRETIGNAIEDQEGIRGPYDLHEGWKWVRLGDKKLFHIETGSTPKTNVIEYWERGNIKWVTPRDLGKVIGKFIFDTERKITQKGLESCSTTIVPKGSIIISTRAPIGHIAIAGDNMCFNQGCKAIVIRDANHVLSDFVYYTLLTKVEEMNALGSGATFKEISRKKLATILIPLPPLEEQKRIVSRLEQLVNRAEEAKRLRKQAREEAEKIMQAALNKVFSRVEEEGWECVKLKEILKEDRRTVNPQEYPDKEFFLVTMDCIESNSGKLLKLDKCLGKEIKSMKYKFDTNHVLYGKLRPYLNKVYVPESEGICTTEFIPFIVTKAVREYVAYYLRRREIVNFAMSNITGTRQPRVIISAFLEHPIPLPPLEEQKKMVEYLDKISEITESLKKLQQRTEEELEKLILAILDRAFKGEL